MINYRKLAKILFNIGIFFAISITSLSFCSYYNSIAQDVSFFLIYFLFVSFLLMISTTELNSCNNFPENIFWQVFYLLISIILYNHLHRRFGFPTTLLLNIEQHIDKSSIFDIIASSGPMGVPILFASFIAFRLLDFGYFIIQISKFKHILFRLRTILTIYIIIDILFAVFYRILYLTTPDYFNKPLSSFIDAVYFSTVIITTLGFGDIVPLKQLARLFVTAEALIGIIFLGVFVATAISLPEED